MESKKTLYIFDEFFTSGKEESISPFLTQGSRKWAKYLTLKSSLCSALFLLGSFASSFFSHDLSAFLLIFVYFISGTPALLSTIEDLKGLEVNIDVLMTMAAFLSFIIGGEMEGGLLLVLFAFSGAMEEAVTKKTKGALYHLKELSPSFATVIEEGAAPFEKSVEEIEIGTHLLIKVGEVVPLDGKVVEGETSLSLSHLTGESLPVLKKKGDEVQGGSRTLDGTLIVEVTRRKQDSTLARIIELINKAQEMKPRVEQLLDRFGKRYATTIIFLFFFFALSLPFFLSTPFFGIEGSIYRSLAFLIAASPCALIIATPTAYLSAISSCARKGILLKGGITLDALAKCKLFAFDKTGTLTMGKLSCIETISLSSHPSFSIFDAISCAVSLEKYSTHPIAEAILTLGKEKNSPFLPTEGFQSIAGLGLQGQVNLKGEKMWTYIGNKSFILSKSSGKNLDFDHKSLKSDMATFLLIKESLYAFYFEDQVRKEAKKMLFDLKTKNKLEILMLTGDHQKSAEKVGKELGIEKVYAELRPEQKLELISHLSLHAPLAMVGDGINDAPALARASVGISMGQIGSRSAIDASDIVLLHDDLSLISTLYEKAQKTLTIVRENLSLALGVICLATIPALLGLLPLWIAVLLHEGGTVLVGLNSLRLLKK
ncbi:MAG: heavy metal translocating P-type ATPase [Simkania negevensis]|nr:heavy metal translocating P-type ATPase [Simkania negevensis]